MAAPTLTDDQTETLEPGVYHSELARTNPGAETVLSQGAITVLPRVGVA